MDSLRKHPGTAEQRRTSGAENLTELAPTNCLVIEDSLAGIVSAKSAGMRAVGVPNTYKAEELLQAGADDIVFGLVDLTPTWINRRFGS